MARKCKLLVLDWEPKALMGLRQILDSGVEATITWDNVVARKLVASAHFDVILVGKENGLEGTQIRSSPAQSGSAAAPKKSQARKVA